ADFNHDQQEDAASDLDVRLLRPGLSVLPNLDIDDPARLPAPRPVDVTGLLDASDSTINGADDQTGLSALFVQPGTPCAVSTSSFTQRLHSEGAGRTRVFLAGLSDPVLGPGEAAGSPSERPLLLLPLVRFELRIQATTHPGDPLLTAPSVAAPAPPEGYLALL